MRPLQYPNSRQLPLVTPATEARRIASSTTQSSNSSDHRDHKSSTDSASLPLYEKGDKFRLMLIGNRTSGKAAILRELSGDPESLDRPPTAETSVLDPTDAEHYLHNHINTTFETNSLLEISNWEGSGVDSDHESSAIQAFIANHLVHMIWYCVPSDLGQAEKFFSVPRQVPVIAVFMDLDRLMDETISTLCTDGRKTYDPSSPQNQFPVSFIDAARESVVQQFEAKYKTVLTQTPNPPDAVVAIPNSCKSTQGRNYLADLVQATMILLRSDDELAKGPSENRSEALFVAAQRADVNPKCRLSFLYGLPDTISQRELEVPRLPFRRRLIQVWGTSFTVTQILSMFKKYVENDRRTIGNSGFVPRPELAAMSVLERKGCRCAQLVADLTFIMAQIFLLKIQKVYVLEALIKEYTGSDAFRSIQEGVIKVYRSSRGNRQSLGDGTRIVMPQIHGQLEVLVRRVSSHAADRFRLLIIGKPGDAKTMILYKVLGEGSLSTVPKIPNEYRVFAETTSSDNGFLVVHDADEPESQRELDVMTQFMASRSRGEDLNKQLHAIWYLLEPSEKTKIAELPFFAVRHEVPVVAIIHMPFETVPEYALQIKSTHAAALKQTAYPPEALVMVVELRKSTPKDSRLTELIQATIKLLRAGDKIPRDDPRHQLENLFIAAQMADVRLKRHLSLSYGLPAVILENEAEILPTLSQKLRVIQIWDIPWPVETILSLFKLHVEESPLTSAIGLPESRHLNPIKRRAARCAQLVAGLALVMEYIFLSKIRDSSLLEDFLEGFTGSSSFSFIQNETINISWNESRAQTHRVKATGPKIFMDLVVPQLTEIVDKSISTEGERFRMLCVGRPGSGKDIVLSKISGQEITLDRSGRKVSPTGPQDDVAAVRTIQSTSIGEEITFTRNEMLVVHDVQPGCPNIQDDINSFIASRSRHQSIAERVHVIWYFLATDQGELTEAQAFFSVPHELPVVVIFTGLDEFVKIELQKISDSESDILQADEEETEEQDPEEQAMSRAMLRFDTQYKHKLMGMQYPPKAVVALSEPHKSDPRDSRLSGLVAATLDCLKVNGNVPKDDPRHRLETLFIAAQMADIGPKRHLSLSFGFPATVGEKYELMPSSNRRLRQRFREIWGPSLPVKIIFSMFKESIEDDPMTIGHPECPLPDIRRLTLVEIKGSRCAQLVANLTSIMEHAFLQNIQDEVAIVDFIKGFTSSPIFVSTRQAVVKIRWDKSRPLPGHDSERVMTTETACDQLKEIMDRVSLVDEEKFRLLVIGKTGCGKTTILSKVCGENVADKPSEFRGVHDIHKEMELKENKHFVVHDSEGFEAGRKREFQVVKRFIESRSCKKKFSEQLHAIWYCLQTNSRPIQQSEKLFFGSEHKVPVIAIFTKFDLFVQDQLQNIMEDEDVYDDEAATDSDLDSNEGAGQSFQAFEERAKSLASKKFEEHYKNVLLQMPYPPKAVVELSNLHDSTPKDSRLGSLIEATLEALTVTDKSIAKDDPRQRLGALFAKAQMAEVSPKIALSVNYGLPYAIHEKELQVPSPLFRMVLIEVWGSKWPVPTIMRIFQNCIEDHPETIGNEGSLSRPEVKKMTSRQRKACRCVQLVADLILIMEQVFISESETINEPQLEGLCKNYLSSRAHAYILEELVNVNWSEFQKETDPTRTITGRANALLKKVLNSCRKQLD